ncbi:hypothetical protein BH09BAC4_BH09BAC4_04220 [soil metagenome]
MNMYNVVPYFTEYQYLSPKVIVFVYRVIDKNHGFATYSFRNLHLLKN